MDSSIASWDSGIPPELVSAVNHLRSEFTMAHFENGRKIADSCFGVLHSRNGSKRKGGSLKDIEMSVPPDVLKSYKALLCVGSLSSVIKGFFELYVESMSLPSVRIFHKLLELGHSNKALIVCPLDWAIKQTVRLIDSKRHVVSRWVKDCCDQQVFDHSLSGEAWYIALDPFEWKTWQAPRFLVMRPLSIGTLGSEREYDGSRAWERLGYFESWVPLNEFENAYVEVLRTTLMRVAGNAAVYMATHDGLPRPAVHNDAVVGTASPLAKKSMVKTKKDAAAAKRHAAIREAIQAGHQGSAYCRAMDSRPISPPREWKLDEWPGSYAAAYNAPRVADRVMWRKRIHKEKSRHSAE